jgi:hypothetical protein
MRFIEVVVVPLVKWAGPVATLMVVYLAAAFLGFWPFALFVALTTVVVVVQTSMMPCRVETKERAPCRKQVKGFWGTREWHGGYKVGLPQRTQRGLMWARGDLAAMPQPMSSTSAAATSHTASIADNTAVLMLWLTAAQVILAAVQTVRTW